MLRKCQFSTKPAWHWQKKQLWVLYKTCQKSCEPICSSLWSSWARRNILTQHHCSLSDTQRRKHKTNCLCSWGLKMNTNSCWARASKTFACIIDNIVHVSSWEPFFVHLVASTARISALVLFFLIYLHCVYNRTQQLRTKIKTCWWAADASYRTAQTAESASKSLCFWRVY